MEEKNYREKPLACDAAMQVKKEENKWEKPTLEDVSSRVMAQPYIRFT